jgi:hypothetical protein
MSLVATDMMMILAETLKTLNSITSIFPQCLEPNRNRTQNPGSIAEPNLNRNPKMLEPEPFLRTLTEPKEPGFSWVPSNIKI